MEAMKASNLVLAKVLDLALEHGISHWTLSFSELGLETEYETFFYPCIKWLEEEGLIRVDAYHRLAASLASGSVRNIALTSRGLGVLGQSVEINGEHEQLSSAVKKVSEGQVDYNRVLDAIGGLLGGIIKSVSS